MAAAAKRKAQPPGKGKSKSKSKSKSATSSSAVRGRGAGDGNAAPQTEAQARVDSMITAKRRPGEKESRRDGHGDGDAARILTGAYLLSARTAAELARRLKQTWTALQQTVGQQQDRDVPLETLRLVCAELLHDKLLEHGDAAVRSLTACCLVELLRVYSPDMPFKSNEELYDAFQLILEQLRCLAVDDSDNRASSGGGSGASSAKKATTDLHSFYLLEGLATSRSYLLLVGMEYTPDDSEDSVMVQLFRALFDTIRKDHSVAIETLMLSIMTTCIEESDSIEQPLLDAILAPLVHATTSSPSEGAEPTDGGARRSKLERGPYRMAQILVRRTSEHLQPHLSQFFNSILVDAPATLVRRAASELKEHVYTLIYEVHKIRASLLLYVLPNVCMQLQVDEVATRSEAIALMGRLFSSSHADYGQDFMKNFRDFLGRFRDVSKEIRLQMVQVCAIIWQRKPDLAKTIEKEFVQRLNDPEWEVRRLVVNEVCDLAANSIDLVGEQCLRRVGERMKDKRVVLRKETMTGLSQVYAAHISSYWGPEDDADDTDDMTTISVANRVPSNHIKKLGWIPDYVLKCFAYPQQELKLRVIQLVDDILLPKAFTEVVRAKGLLFLFHSMDSIAREALRRIFNERMKCQRVMAAFLKEKKVLRGQTQMSSLEKDSKLENAKETLQLGLSPLFPETDGLSKLLDQLSKWKDHSIFKLLDTLCASSTTQQDARQSRDKLIKAVGSKSPLGGFLKMMCRKLNQLTVSRGTISTYLTFIIHNRAKPHRENRTVTDLLLLISRTTPDVFGPFIREKFEAILVNDGEPAGAPSEDDDDDDGEESRERDGRVIIATMDVLGRYARHWKISRITMSDTLDKDAMDSTPSDRVKAYLQQCCLGEHSTEKKTTTGIGIEAKYAALILADFYADSKDLGALISKLTSKKNLSTPQAPNAGSVLRSLHVLAKRSPRYFKSNASMLSSVWQLVVDEFVFQRSSIPSGDLPKTKKQKGGVTIAQATEIRCFALKLAANLLMYCHDDKSANVVERSRVLMKTLFDILRSDGKLWSASGTLPAKCRATASCCLVKLVRNRRIEMSLSTSEWHILGFVMQDTSYEVRREFVKKLTANLMHNTVPRPHKYLSYLALAATEVDVTLKKSVRGLLGVAVERMRRIFEASSSTVNVGGGDRHRSGGDDDTHQNAHALMVPEYALTYVIHLLAHHPDFPGGDTTGGGRGPIIRDPMWNEQVAYLSFFLDGLISANGAQVDNIAFLLQMLTKLSSCHDTTDPTSNDIYPLIDCAVSLLKRRIKKQSNLKAFPGKLFLPKQLYGTGRATTSTSRDDANRTSSVQEMPTKLFGEDLRMDTSLSPIKPPRGGDAHLMLNSPAPPSAQKRKPSPPGSAAKRKSPKISKSGTPSRSPATSDGTNMTPPRRQSLMRQARTQAKTFVYQSSDSGDDSDHFVISATVASRLSKKSSAGSDQGDTSGQGAISGQAAVTELPQPSGSIDPAKSKAKATERDEGDDSAMEVENAAPIFRVSRRKRRNM